MIVTIKSYPMLNSNFNVGKITYDNMCDLLTALCDLLTALTQY